MLVQPGVADLGRRAPPVRAEPDRGEGGPEAADVLPGGSGADEGVAQPVNCGLEQPVLFDILGELVEADLDGQWDAETPPDLVAEADASPHRGERVLLPPVALKQAAVDGLPGVVREGEGDRFEHVGGTL